MGDTQFFSGVIEGFFGQDWSFAGRKAIAHFLGDLGSSSYIYAPKSDVFLRRRWQDDIPQSRLSELQALRNVCLAVGVKFGLGLTPLGTQTTFLHHEEDALRRKLDRLNKLNLDLLCLLFDDMRGDLPGLAHTQLRILQLVKQHSNASRLIFCPTYYSTDPILEQAFGERPAHYWQDIAQRLDDTISIFWTGSAVCSMEYPESHLETVTKMFGRPVVIWDNQIANDGKNRVSHLFVGAPPCVSSPLRNLCAGHLVNPMNQAFLSMLTLERIFSQKAEWFGEHFAQTLVLLERDAIQFQEGGLLTMSDRDKRNLLKDYRAVDEPPAQEVVQWLLGRYAFDPACLTF